MSRILLFAIFASPGLWLLACSAGKEQLINNPDLILSSRNTEALVSIRITPDQMATLPSMTRQLKFEANGEKKKTKVVYLSDILESFQENKDLDFWVVNCGDKYQSNFTPAVIESTRPYLVLDVEAQPLVD